MQEKFHQFNRQDTAPKIQEGLDEMDDVKKEGVSKNPEQKEDTKESDSESKPLPMSFQQKELLFSTMNTPSHILELPSNLRQEGLKFFQEKVADRHLAISRFQKSMFRYIEKEHEKGTLDTEALQNYANDEWKYEGLTLPDKKLIERSLGYFIKNYNLLSELRKLSKEELFHKFVRNNSQLSQIKGGYAAKVTPYSVDFVFDDVNDFRIFVSNTEGEEKDKYKHTYGLSFMVDGVPITASGTNGVESDTTRIHEEQHKKFHITQTEYLGNKYSDMERDTRNELLARIAEGDTSFSYLYSGLMQYSFWRVHGTDKSKHEELLRKSIAAVKELEKLHITDSEIVGILAKEKLDKWPKIADRIKRSKTGYKIHSSRQELQSELRKRYIQDMLEEEDNKTLQKMESVLEQGIEIDRTQNEKGSFYGKIRKKDILNELKRKNIYLKPRYISLQTEPIDSPGDYDVDLILHNDRKATFQLHVRDK